jgi:protein-tyrosine kinase
MSKIYEALQNAQRETREMVKPKTELARTTEATLLPSVIDLDFDAEMVMLYRNIELRLPDLDKKVIQFIGSHEGEGTSTIVREFARVTAKKLGKSVFLLDADQHNPRQQIFLHITPECGWEEVSRHEVAAGNASDWGEADREENPTQPDPIPTPLNFYSPLMRDFWECLKKRYDVILVDSAPFSLSPEGVEIARRVDGVVLVVEAEKTRWQVVENMKEKIENAGANIIGAVFNKRRFHIPEAIYKRL